MRTVTTQELAALSNPHLKVRTLVTVWPKNRSTGAEVQFGFSTIEENATLPVFSGLTQEEENRDFIGRGALMAVDPIALDIGLNVRTTRIDLSSIDPATEDAFRTYDMRLARIEIHRAIIDPDNARGLVAAARPRFVGFVDKCVIVTPSEGGEGSATLDCVSITRELTRANSMVRSDESQQRRSSDRGFRYADATGQIPVNWGKKSGDV